MAAPKNGWPTGICGCMDDCGTCCYGFWCPCCLFGNNAEKLGDGGCCLNCCLYYLLAAFCCNSCFAAPKRGRLRANHNLGEEPCGDCCTHFWCSTCAICQEARVIKKMGPAPAYYQPPPMAGPPPQQFMTV